MNMIADSQIQVETYTQMLKSDYYTSNKWSFWHEPRDSHMVAEEVCACGGKCFYRGFVKEKVVGLIYRAFSICKKCGRVEEF